MLLANTTITVNTTVDENAANRTLSLLEAILIADGDTTTINRLSASEKAQISGELTNPLIIQFHIATSDTGYSSPTTTWTSRPTFALPNVTKVVTIDSTTQVGYSSANLKAVIELSGNLAGAGASGLTLSGAGGDIIKGLAIDRFKANGISITSSNNQVIFKLHWN